MLKHSINTGLLITVLLLLAILSFFTEVSWWGFIIPVAVWFIIAATGSGLIRSGYHLDAYCSNPEIKDKKVAITFDDGPTPETIPVLALLKKYNAKATFFCIGRQVFQHPEILKETVAQGHSVGNHTYSHSHYMGFFSSKKIVEELADAASVIKESTGLQPTMYRPPYGVTTPAMAKAVKKTGYSVIGWNIRSLDGILKDEDEIFNRIESRLAPGSIILLHDTSQKSVNVLERLLVLLQQNNYQSVTVNELLNIPAYEK